MKRVGEWGLQTPPLMDGNAADFDIVMFSDCHTPLLLLGGIECFWQDPCQSCSFPVIMKWRNFWSMNLRISVKHSAVLSKRLLPGNLSGHLCPKTAVLFHSFRLKVFYVLSPPPPPVNSRDLAFISFVITCHLQNRHVCIRALWHRCKFQLSCALPIENEVWRVGWRMFK